MCARWFRVLMIAAVLAWGYGAAVHAIPSLDEGAAGHSHGHCPAADDGGTDDTTQHEESGGCCDPTHCSAAAVLLDDSAESVNIAFGWRIDGSSIPPSDFDGPAGPPPNS